MSKIMPQFTFQELNQNISKPLPGVKADAKKMDVKAHKTNRKLAKKIEQLVKTLKPKNEKGEYFMLSWRLYPNKTHPIWKEKKGSHFCGCGCGAVTDPRPPKKKKRAARRRKPKGS